MAAGIVNLLASDGPGRGDEAAETRNEKTPAKPGFSAGNQTDGEGFEPPVQLPAQQFSRLPP